MTPFMTIAPTNAATAFLALLAVQVIPSTA